MSFKKYKETVLESVKENGIADSKISFIKEMVDNGKSFLIVRGSDIDGNIRIRVGKSEDEYEEGRIIFSDEYKKQIDKIDEYINFKGNIDEFIDEIKNLFGVRGNLVLQARKEFGPVEWMAGITPEYFTIIDENYRTNKDR